MSEKKQGDTYHVSSLGQQGGITAGQLNIGPQPRVLDDTARAMLLREIPREKPVKVTSVMGDPETYQAAQQIEGFLRSNGYDVRIGQSMFHPPRFDLSLENRDDHNELIVGHRTQNR